MPTLCREPKIEEMLARSAFRVSKWQRTAGRTSQTATARFQNVQHKNHYLETQPSPQLQKGEEPASSNGCVQYRVWINWTACSLHYESFSLSKRIAAPFHKAALQTKCGECPLRAHFSKCCGSDECLLRILQSFVEAVTTLC